MSAQDQPWKAKAQRCFAQLRAELAQFRQEPDATSQGSSCHRRQPPPGDTAAGRGCSSCLGSLPKKSASAPRDAGAAPRRAQPVNGWLMIFGFSPQALLPQGQSSEAPSFTFPNGQGTGMLWMSIPSEPVPSSSITPVYIFPSHSRNPKLRLLALLLPRFSLFLWELARAAVPWMGAGTGRRLEEARGTALGPCYILFQKAIADISTTYTTARDILCYKGFQKHKPPELNTYSMASGGRFRVFRD